MLKIIKKLFQAKKEDREKRKGKSEQKDDKTDEELVKERLKSLGYL